MLQVSSWSWVNHSSEQCIPLPIFLFFCFLKVVMFSLSLCYCMKNEHSMRLIYRNERDKKTAKVWKVGKAHLLVEILWRKITWDALQDIEKNKRVLWIEKPCISDFDSRSHIFQTLTCKGSQLFEHTKSLFKNFPKRLQLEYQTLERVSWVMPGAHVWGKAWKCTFEIESCSKEA